MSITRLGYLLLCLMVLVGCAGNARTDAPMAPSVPIQAFNHQLGQSDVSLFATQTLVSRYPGTTPERFMGAPFLMPGTKTSVRRALNAWLERHALRVHEAAEVDDRAMMMVFAEKGVGFLAAPVSCLPRMRSCASVQRRRKASGMPCSTNSTRGVA